MNAKNTLSEVSSILTSLDETAAAQAVMEASRDILTALGRVRTVGDEGNATRSGLSYGTASLSKALRLVTSLTARDKALVLAAWPMAHALALPGKNVLAAGE
jgi:hypothetical protein